ncbi:MAG: 5-formyltetrahydrofolate cyclo-ligase [Candidatus Omnitrophica bacterium]|nr:5-formyltetrahydrofolate cyclo-ligase [Candidatus Omnitrophota bacterium]
MKRILREKILTLLRNQKEEERLVKSLAIGNKLFQMEEFQKAETILFYASFDGEVETFEMMREAQKLGKTIGLPGIIKDERKIVPTAVASLEADLETGPYGIQQPKIDQDRTLREDLLDMAIVPGVAFDKKNNRLGRGGGYYDRFLASLPPSVLTVGLAFDFQIVDSLSFQEKHDIPVSCVLTH